MLLLILLFYTGRADMTVLCFAIKLIRIIGLLDYLREDTELFQSYFDQAFLDSLVCRFSV